MKPAAHGVQHAPPLFEGLGGGKEQPLSRAQSCLSQNSSCDCSDNCSDAGLLGMDQDPTPSSSSATEPCLGSPELMHNVSDSRGMVDTEAGYDAACILSSAQHALQALEEQDVEPSLPLSTRAPDGYWAGTLTCASASASDGLAELAELNKVKAAPLCACNGRRAWLRMLQVTCL